MKISINRLIILIYDYIWFLDDCEYGLWTPWSPCTLTSGVRRTNRTREIETDCRGNGTSCDVDSLYDEKDCSDGTYPITDL